ncbi:hypothetical protein JCM19235_185 [Vibrio maritimus]|uniref:Uncharacterized protein n=1 Tax=Vibrio maritimus TaxID=990268 RepID=A0A090RZM3_9VIBR|nr:hypothetical protein JCM19235_185 [Vibrio maritimus]
MTREVENSGVDLIWMERQLKRSLNIEASSFCLRTYQAA